MERRLINTLPERRAGEAVATSAELTKPAELLEQLLHAQEKMLTELAADEFLEAQIHEFVSKNLATTSEDLTASNSMLRTAQAELRKTKSE